MLDRLTLDQLRVFIAAVETGSFSAAARKLNRAQSAISQTVCALETTLETPLFDRTARVPALTEFGRAIIEDARRLVRDAERIKGRARAYRADREAALALAVDVMFPNALL